MNVVIKRPIKPCCLLVLRKLTSLYVASSFFFCSSKSLAMDIKKRPKVAKACVYCKRSHMTCDDGTLLFIVNFLCLLFLERPCKRCVKRNIASLCRNADDPVPFVSPPIDSLLQLNGMNSESKRFLGPSEDSQPNDLDPSHQSPNTPLSIPQGLRPPSRYGNDSSDDVILATKLLYNGIGMNSKDSSNRDGYFLAGESFVRSVSPHISEYDYLYVAANPIGTNEKEKLNRVIQKKYEAGLLKPFPYYQSEVRMRAFAEMNFSTEGVIRILKLLDLMRSNISTIVDGLTELDFLVEEEAICRSLMDYERYLSAVSVPCCIWRRSGEVIKANASFLNLLGLNFNPSWKKKELSCIYQLLTEESYINYLEKYSEIFLDESKRAVLTRAYLVSPNTSSVSPNIAIPCCFSFTLNRGPCKLPQIIIGQFIPSS